ncbi:MAG: ferrous iron transport protein B [Deltaproteobacteria bacterium]|nr:ferrous iron transport protein B [Deltaproteobacteria bacterium]
MKKVIRMREMQDNQAGIIRKVFATGEMGRRIREMGLVPDTPIQIQGRAPLKDPVAIKIRDYTLTLRNNEASYIMVEVEMPDGQQKKNAGKKLIIALSGNPNSGKTTVFNAMTGARQHIANYPGVTVEKKVGRVFHKGYEIEVVDLPGTYSLTAYSLEEIVARDFVVNERPDLVVDVVDASNLDRNLYLAVQFKELGVPLMIALNMMDLAESRGISIDPEELSRLMGVPVIPMVARSSKGIKKLLDKIVEFGTQSKEWEPTVITYGRDIDQSLAEIEDIVQSSQVADGKYPSRWLAIKCLEGDSQILGFLENEPEPGPKIEKICSRTTKHLMATLEEEPEGIIADYRYGYIAGVTKKCLRRKIESRLNLSDHIDRILTNRILGPVIMILVLYGIYSITFYVSEAPVNWLGSLFDLLKQGIALVIPAGNLQSLIVSGVIDGMGGVLGFVPLIMFMFLAIAVMEDSGYMARVAYMLDRVLRWFGLHGNSVMALIVSGGISGGCAVPGVMATRTLRDPKERIATLLVVPFMNCGAKLPVYAVLIAAFFPHNRAQMLFILTLLSWGFALFAAKVIRATVLKGPKTPFVMELPPYRAPTIKGLLIHTWERTWQYIKKAGTVILGISIVLWAMMTFPGLSKEQIRTFSDRTSGLRKAFLTAPHVKNFVKSPRELESLNSLYFQYRRARQPMKTKTRTVLERNPLFPLVQTATMIEKARSWPEMPQKELVAVARRYLQLQKGLKGIAVQKQEATLNRTVAGWIGRGLEWVTRPLGFDYRVNIALVGGFAAKEIVISTLGTAYSLGETDPEAAGSLSDRLKSDPRWDPLLAFTFLVFTMLYVPCFATVIIMSKESSWRWAAFSIGFNLVVAYMIALVIAQGGRLLGLGG